MKIVPLNSAFTQVTTRKGGPYYVNGASLNGGTLIWISGFSNFFFINQTKALICYYFYFKGLLIVYLVPVQLVQQAIKWS